MAGMRFLRLVLGGLLRTPLAAALVVACGVAAALAFLVLPAVDSDFAPGHQKPPGTALAAPTSDAPSPTPALHPTEPAAEIARLQSPVPLPTRSLPPPTSPPPTPTPRIMTVPTPRVTPTATPTPKPRPTAPPRPPRTTSIVPLSITRGEPVAPSDHEPLDGRPVPTPRPTATATPRPRPTAVPPKNDTRANPSKPDETRSGGSGPGRRDADAHGGSSSQHRSPRANDRPHAEDAAHTDPAKQNPSPKQDPPPHHDPPSDRDKKR